MQVGIVKPSCEEESKIIWTQSIFGFRDCLQIVGKFAV